MAFLENPLFVLFPAWILVLADPGTCYEYFSYWHFHNASKEYFWSKKFSNFMHRFKSAILAIFQFFFGLGKDFLFKYALGHCEWSLFFITLKSLTFYDDHVCGVIFLFLLFFIYFFCICKLLEKLYLLTIKEQRGYNMLS